MLELSVLNQLATQIVGYTGLTPFSFFVASIALAVILLLLDLNKGASLDIPGKGQIGLSATIFLAGALIMILAAEGYKFFFVEIAKTTLSLMIITPIVFYLLGRSR